MPKYERVLLKLSGESLMGSDNYGINADVLNEYSQQIKEVVEKGVQVGIVVGGGNIFRGLKGVGRGFDRVKGDYMGMLATVINSLALQSSLECIGVKTRVMTAIDMEPIGESYSKFRTEEAFSKNEVVIFSAGTGNPFFTTDTASALRACEIGADVLLKGTRVNGIYSEDPEKNPEAQKFDSITFDEVYDKDLKVMDMTAFTLCKQNHLPIIVFDMDTVGNLKKVIKGETVGTLVHL